MADADIITLAANLQHVEAEIAARANERLGLKVDAEHKAAAKFYRYFPDCDPRCTAGSTNESDHIIRLGSSCPICRALYPKHVILFDGSREHRERWFMAANRIGKSDGGAFEVTSHLTGDYPAWWTGRRFRIPVECWVAGETGKKTREVVQKKLAGLIAPEEGSPIQLGEPIGLGTGMIPGHLIVHHAMKPGVPNAIDTMWVRHVTGGLSHLTFKSYEQGRTGFDGDAVHIIWLDEEPPLEIYTECVLRTMTTEGLVLVTGTPLEGRTELVDQFLPVAPEPPTTESFGRSSEGSRSSTV